MKKFELFKPEHFVYGNDRAVDHRAEIHASYANYVLNGYIESCPVVYLYGYGNPLDSEISLNKSNWKDRVHYNISSNLKRSITHQARLFNIEPIVREPCKGHEPDPIDSGTSNCIHCGVELVETWSEKK